MVCAMIGKVSTGSFPPMSPTPERLHELRSMPYPAYLQSPEWRAKRLEHLRKVGWRCQLTNRASSSEPRGGDLAVHHRTYERLGSERFVDLVALHEDVHEQLHKLFEIPGGQPKASPSPSSRGRARLVSAGVVGAVAASLLLLLLQPWSVDELERLDCDNLSYELAQQVLRSNPSDPHGLDGNKDGEACDSKR
jgi:hypothetical protein